jgi:hypothetical protein
MVFYHPGTIGNGDLPLTCSRKARAERLSITESAPNIMIWRFAWGARVERVEAVTTLSGPHKRWI